IETGRLVRGRWRLTIERGDGIERHRGGAEDLDEPGLLGQCKLKWGVARDVDILGEEGCAHHSQRIEERTEGMGTHENGTGAEQAVVGQGSQDRPRALVGPHIALLSKHASLLEQTLRDRDLVPHSRNSCFRLVIAGCSEVLRALLALGVVVLPVIERMPLYVAQPDRARGADQQKGLLHGLALELRIRRLKQQRMPGKECRHRRAVVIQTRRIDNNFCSFKRARPNARARAAMEILKRFLREVPWGQPWLLPACRECPWPRACRRIVGSRSAKSWTPQGFPEGRPKRRNAECDCRRACDSPDLEGRDHMWLGVTRSLLKS